MKLAVRGTETWPAASVTAIVARGELLDQDGGGPRLVGQEADSRAALAR
ncbi:MAG TPA: hypothetical protein VNT32_14970 [Thermoleophilaceae bacterium]|nr:hypothetical protein [Thermoleophilaceae bacterium]